MTDNQPPQPQTGGPANSGPSFGANPPERTQQLPMYGQHQQQQFAPQGGSPQLGQPGPHPSGGSAYPQFGQPGAHQGASPGPNWPFGPQPQAAPSAPSKPKRAGLAIVAATALLVGAAGGVGAAAVYSATNDTSANPSVTAPLSGNQAAPASAPDGSVQQAAAKVLSSVVKIAVSTQQGAGTGSGIVISKDGLIVTNNHVVGNGGAGARITVILNDGRTVRATIKGTDPLTDLAVIKADATDLTPATLGASGKLAVGQGVVAIGSPFGLQSTVTSGIVSALDRPVTSGGQEQDRSTTVFPAIQTDAAINPGNSGGALIDLAGQVVGINSAIKTAGGSGQSEGGNIGLGFAIPIDQAKPIIDELVAKGKATHARLGVTVGDAQSSDGLTSGARLGEATPGGAADKAGLQADDVVTAVDGKVIASGDALVAAVRSHRPGDEVKVTYIRAGKSQTVTATLGSDNGNPTG
ncbi:PDZ domain-containing protein [Kribbella sandramycini]|uniref:PDZ domain-containing protein n=1 Tax=Kribbella sandramycini TaxID=60450 RepID=A0A7Y4KZN8_9ACTN|nr:trypsin-like peptidase domain-containing protein [Kribbella sandramycini]MBB6565349.1 putative serine protease PepD [Kribbella sandramycini]NOL41618.1 PDZ domain-containing protein [Kribbella sandramycini]